MKVQLRKKVAIPVATPEVAPTTNETTIATPKPMAAAATWILRSVRLNSTVWPSDHPSIANSGIQPTSRRDTSQSVEEVAPFLNHSSLTVATTYLRSLEGQEDKNWEKVAAAIGI
jgi:hypothetical protein